MGDEKAEGKEESKKASPAKAKKKKRTKKEEKAKKLEEDKSSSRPSPSKEDSEKEETLELNPELEGEENEGQLAIDVYETNGDIVVQSTIGGIKADDLDISIEGDLVTIRGSRENKVEREGKKYFYQECFWGSFMRKVILPEEVNSSDAKAVIKDGVLTLTMPKLHRKKKNKIAVKQDE